MDGEIVHALLAQSLMTPEGSIVVRKIREVSPLDRVAHRAYKIGARVQTRVGEVYQIGDERITQPSPIPFGRLFGMLALRFGARLRVAGAFDHFFDKARLAHPTLAANEHNLTGLISAINRLFDLFKFNRSIDESFCAPRRGKELIVHHTDSSLRFSDAPKSQA
ncbi:MAG: hypothetical protein HY868_16530 [Chloroflexi bacterium]|nr:hypothetical protein [Chloroflexota bacterium]